MRKEVFGMKAKEMLTYLLQDTDAGSMFSVEKRTEYRCAGIFPAGKKFVAFDNYTSDCFVEEFESFKEAVRWIRYEEKPDNGLIITAESGDIMEVYLSPEKTPNAFLKKVRCLQSSGFLKEEAEREARNTPIQLELYYSVGQGLFAVEAEAIGNTPIHNPYDGREIPEIEQE